MPVTLWSSYVWPELEAYFENNEYSSEENSIKSYSGNSTPLLDLSRSTLNLENDPYLHMSFCSIQEIINLDIGKLPSTNAETNENREEFGCESFNFGGLLNFADYSSSIKKEKKFVKLAQTEPQLIDYRMRRRSCEPKFNDAIHHRQTDRWNNFECLKHSHIQSEFKKTVTLPIQHTEQENDVYAVIRPEGVPYPGYRCDICKSSGHFIYYCPFRFKKSALTPYQGNKNCIGEYVCSKCKRVWHSIKSVANDFQNCKKCDIKSYPRKQYDYMNVLCKTVDFIEKGHLNELLHEKKYKVMAHVFKTILYPMHLNTTKEELAKKSFIF